MAQVSTDFMLPLCVARQQQATTVFEAVRQPIVDALNFVGDRADLVTLSQQLKETDINVVRTEDVTRNVITRR